MGGVEDIGTFPRGSFNRSIPSASLDFLHHPPDQRGDRFEAGAVPKHLGEHGLPFGIHIVHFT